VIICVTGALRPLNNTFESVLAWISELKEVANDC